MKNLRDLTTFPWAVDVDRLMASACSASDDPTASDMPFRVLILSLLSISAQADDLFSSQVLPILKDNCYECHSHEADKMKGGLTLDSRSGWANGGDSGPTIIPGKPENSLLITAIRHEDSDYEMPPKKKLSDDEIAIITNWIKRGAPDPRDTQAKKNRHELVVTPSPQRRETSHFRAPY